jgi:hypothetical protein
VVPARDPELHPHGRVRLPDDPSGIIEPHDVLAAEEFAMPAPRAGGGRLPSPPERKGRLVAVAAALAALLVVGVRRRLNRTA